MSSNGQHSAPPPIEPALAPDEWARFLATGEAGLRAALRESLKAAPYSPHALAALLLHGEPFGFTQQDVDDETDVAGYCDKMARDNTAAGDEATAALFRSLGGRHRVRAAKIAALLPPVRSTDSGTN